jgi:hypothetical protein
MIGFRTIYTRAEEIIKDYNIRNNKIYYSKNNSTIVIYGVLVISTPSFCLHFSNERLAFSHHEILHT